MFPPFLGTAPKPPPARGGSSSSSVRDSGLCSGLAWRPGAWGVSRQQRVDGMPALARTAGMRGDVPSVFISKDSFSSCLAVRQPLDSPVAPALERVLPLCRHRFTRVLSRGVLC